MGNGKPWALLAVLLLQFEVSEQQTTDECDDSLAPNLRGADCGEVREVIECNLAGEHCYVYDALMPFCPMHEAFFDSPFGTLRAAGPATCTTTTTATRTVTHTTTRTMTLWTTTRGQSIECRDFCYLNTNPWIVKCGWPVCASCSECAAILLPSSQVDTSLDPDGLVTVAPTRRNTTRPATTSRAAGGGGAPVFDGSDGSLEEAAGRDLTTTQESTTAQLQSTACLMLCYDAVQYIGWQKLCEWATCVICPECSGTSFTTTSSTIPVPVTVTITSTMVSQTSLFTTSSTTASQTSTASSTSTTSATETITSTTTDRACAPPTAVLANLMATEDCKGNLSAGDFCIAPLAEHPCIYAGDLILQCPRNNILHRESELMSGDYQSKCRVCGWGSTEWEDTDPVGGKMTVSLEFGANALLGVVNETMVFGYGIFLADNCSRPIKRDLVGYVPKMEQYPYDERCCTPTAYSTTVMFDVPPGFTSVRLIIRPNTTLGFLPLGEMTEEILDSNQSKAVTSDARERRASLLTLALLLAMR